MIKSMTGFGKSIAEFPEKNVIIEIKSLNSKQLDLNTRISHIFREKDLEIRSVLSEKLVRGKIDICIYYDNKEGVNERTINETLVKSYCKQIQRIAQELGVNQDSVLDIAMRMPDVLSSESNNTLTDEEWLIIKQALNIAIEKITEFRMQEGAALEVDIRKNIQTISNLLVAIAPFENQRMLRVKERMMSSFDEYFSAEKIDKNRFEQEMLFYIEKLDINEEKVRLTQHCSYFLETMGEDSPGKKLSFIAQEIGREINTIGSKSNDADMQKIVVEMKDNLERIKEQVLNIQ